ncbi:hypothetical protein FB567DRAFT_552326 [Paraphoma chrysanthemicola]|uniref:Uncharacterized protein n=1 Tax=Paraphoma chrysanthemicola TaxID=798071 RepID=A0A8K0R0M6_9PLEO|nr:hypothetical protein FB567DRAFT_552326 [Paraphoma chrysanthemicola]
MCACFLTAKLARATCTGEITRCIAHHVWVTCRSIVALLFVGKMSGGEHHGRMRANSCRRREQSMSQVLVMQLTAGRGVEPRISAAHERRSAELVRALRLIVDANEMATDEGRDKARWLARRANENGSGRGRAPARLVLMRAGSIRDRRTFKQTPGRHEARRAQRIARPQRQTGGGSVPGTRARISVVLIRRLEGCKRVWRAGDLRIRSGESHVALASQRRHPHVFSKASTLGWRPGRLHMMTWWWQRTAAGCSDAQLEQRSSNSNQRARRDVSRKKAQRPTQQHGVLSYIKTRERPRRAAVLAGRRAERQCQFCECAANCDTDAAPSHRIAKQSNAQHCKAPASAPTALHTLARGSPLRCAALRLCSVVPIVVVVLHCAPSDRRLQSNPVQSSPVQPQRPPDAAAAVL